MRIVTRAGSLLAIGLAGLVGCSSARQPTPQPNPVASAPDPKAAELARKREASKYQQEIVMAEVTRTHPVLSATLDRNIDKLRAAIKKRGKVNEVRRDMRLGPPLREACRLRWKEGIEELIGNGAQCLGDTQCESCVRNMGQARPAGAAPASGAMPTSAPRQAPAGGVRPTP